MLGYIGRVSRGTLRAALEGQNAARITYDHERRLTVTRLPEEVKGVILARLSKWCSEHAFKKALAVYMMDLFGDLKHEPGRAKKVSLRKALEQVDVSQIPGMLGGWGLQFVGSPAIGRQVAENLPLHHLCYPVIAVANTLKDHALSVCSPIGPERAKIEALNPADHSRLVLLEKPLRAIVVQVVELITRGVVLADASMVTGIKLPGSTLRKLLNIDGSDYWAMFDGKLWRGISCLTKHVRTELPGIAAQELGIIAARFAEAGDPVSDYQRWRSDISERIRTTVESRIPSSSTSSPSVPHERAPNMGGILRPNQLRADLRSRLSQQNEVERYLDTLMTLIGKVGDESGELVLRSLKHGDHPESIARELRNALRDRYRELRKKPVTSDRNETSSTDGHTLLKPSAPLNIEFYRSPDGRHSAEDWFSTVDLSTANQVRVKISELSAGLTGKSLKTTHLTRGGSNAHGLFELRIQLNNATLRVYYLPPDRSTNTIVVLLIGTKTDQRDDVREAARRADSFVTQRTKRELRPS
jgi:hypothetical protein